VPTGGKGEGRCSEERTPLQEGTDIAIVPASHTYAFADAWHGGELSSIEALLGDVTASILVCVKLAAATSVWAPGVDFMIHCLRVSWDMFGPQESTYSCTVYA
jgi:hypothetical protein